MWYLWKLRTRAEQLDLSVQPRVAEWCMMTVRGVFLIDSTPGLGCLASHSLRENTAACPGMSACPVYARVRTCVLEQWRQQGHANMQKDTCTRTRTRTRKRTRTRTHASTHARTHARTHTHTHTHAQARTKHETHVYYTVTKVGPYTSQALENICLTHNEDNDLTRDDLF